MARARIVGMPDRWKIGLWTRADPIVTHFILGSAMSEFIELEVVDGEGRRKRLIDKSTIVGVESVESNEYPGRPHSRVLLKSASIWEASSVLVKEHYTTVKAVLSK